MNTFINKLNYKKYNVLLILFLGVISSCSSNLPDSMGQEQLSNSNKSNLVENYYIGVDDRVQVNVWKHPELSILTPVRPDGIISVPLIGEIMAGGRTPLEVSDAITKKLSNFVREPRVAVILVELRSHEFLSRVRITGAVRNPRSLNYRQGMTVLDIVLEAGGLNEFASANNTKLFRKVNGKVESIGIELLDILNEGNMRTNIPVEPGDIISIPERVF